MRLALITTLVLLAAPARAESVRHLPPAEATAGAPLEIVAEVARAWESTLTLHYRPVDAGAWSTAAFTRTEEDAWRAVVPGEAIAWPGVEYYIDSVAPGEGAAVTPEFASAAAPHTVRIVRTKNEIRRERDLARVDQRRSRIHVAGEYVDYGRRDDLRDAYYRIDADFAYRLLTYPLEQIRFGYARMLGDVPNSELEAPPVTEPERTKHVGFKVGGWFEVRLGVGDGVDLDARGMVLATDVGFAVGGRGELRFGVEDGNHVAVAVEAIQDIGTTTGFRLGWATVPRLPMAATVEVTDMPSEIRATGVRFVYDIAFPMTEGTRIGGRIGYQARDADIGGISGGANLTMDF
jgi:hypothetical protein